MELRQLTSLVALEESGFNVTLAAKHLFLVQSAVSQHLAQLEQELGTQLFMRKGKRLIGLTAAGEEVLNYARQALAIRENILDVGREHVEEGSGLLRIGTTHTQACYVLPAVIRAFRKQFPQVNLQINQGTPQQLVELVVTDRVDFSICTEELGEHSTLTAIPCYRWNRSLIALKGHPVLSERPLSLERICNYPLITYTFGFTGANHMQTTFARAGLQPNVVLTAADTDVIKTYVREGMGIGLIASMAYSPELDPDLETRDLSHMLPWETTWVAYHKDKYLRRYQKRFIDLLEQMILDNGAAKLEEEN
ncbi:MAG: LysR substrate-binding domain-containing protein [Candidatus Thiodiazotropha lotti]|uniref:LysR substrate-binding domain-containing protein n=1 Tax=Candidatus Thiodiazotropha endoloripes TaxID=1818881 RepID=UPI00083D480F|nr:LysR substrate-binding domain-containing protein [Candidatus Thiodiazotropha endoloripes]MCG7915685.1 LysR substrate-binding domain-containing protein [Candidatus Thiodiazotropha weberae]MCG7990631.1 LysR substrate-binding domain-containing protein [Candidatus Thiodiazotropha lotti]MCG7999505.1 LysR substrate-binding domain-containing protein [Candidatus Thiodiazotropha lotti]MCW4182285.1 LysR substrate-binding domain-containing protein [Candidatus Thiodiazotropha weberae]MCW4191273.1 LysR 